MQITTPWPAARELRAIARLLCRPSPPLVAPTRWPSRGGIVALAERSVPRTVPADQVAQLHDTLAAWRHATGGGLLTVFDAAYPELLRHIARPPLVLFVQGEVAALHVPMVAMVGSRAATPSARHWTHAVAGDLARCGVVVASGLARGIDAAAHAGALDAGGKSIGVLGCGLDRIYPPEHTGLALRVVARGCLVSEFPPGTPPRAWHFPLRNRILSGLAAGVVVVQAEPRSGALVTARHALEENRQVMAVPGDVSDARSRGPHDLLRQGAALVEDLADIFAALGWSAAAPAPPPARATTTPALVPASTPLAPSDATRVLGALDEASDAEALRAMLGWEASRVQQAIAALELAGLVQRAAGGALRRAGW